MMQLGQESSAAQSFLAERAFRAIQIFLMSDNSVFF
jgi:hypothetical protein